MSRFPSSRIDLNAKNAKILAKFTRRCREILLFFGLGGHSFAAFVGFASRTLRFQPTENALSRFPPFRMISTQRTQRHFAKFSKTLPRDSLLCVLRGLPFAAFAFSAYRIHAISHSIFHVDPNAKNANYIRKAPKDATARFSPFASFAGFASRTLRFLLIESTLFLIAFFTLIQTQRTKRTSQRSQRRCRGRCKLNCQTSTNHRKHNQRLHPFEPQNAQIV